MLRWNPPILSGDLHAINGRSPQPRHAALQREPVQKAKITGQDRKAIERNKDPN